MQNRRGIIFLALALAMGLLAAWLTQRMVSPTAPQVVTLDTTPVVVVKSDLAVATPLTPDVLTVAQWPSEHVPQGAHRAAEVVVGRVVNRPIRAGEPLLENALFANGTTGGLPAMIEAGARAVTVKVDNVIGVAGFIAPGARVDVMATIRRIDRETALPYSKVILQNIRVLAVDQKLEGGRLGAGEPVSVVTLEVDPEQAQHLIYAAHEGRIQLAMRSPSDQTEVNTESVGVVDVLGQPFVKPEPKPKPKPRRVAETPVQVLNGTELETQKF